MVCLRNISVDTLHKENTNNNNNNNKISHFSASARKHSPSLGHVINRIRLDGVICNLKSFLQLNMFQELQNFAFVCTYWDAGYVFAVVTLGLLP
jgi:hypothetical protein